MRKHAAKQSDDAEIDMTPMLDIVFIMLIFFIVTASFLKEAGIDINRPDASTAVKADKANIMIAVSEKNEVWMEKRRVDVRAVRANVERLRAENPEGSVVIQADVDAKAGVVMEVVDAVRMANVSDYVVATKEN
ncbi:ExbD/TolR family protein [Paremcibacter congregatus]|uniref:Biopolymer transporter ExbD n=1 Tax=Paremcibacter congregatus TaxID=2043170 RepID=A0A2G4YRP3_9PROT|nr:biopolymer transporter ExbD [Paremcibacter congregatus]PHZ85014.1 biopolymer transporter ExbD [Paremcibacter congregatus]QDE26010.1 biopolymer transporter ExbD [Paremcibacter congregatus]